MRESRVGFVCRLPGQTIGARAGVSGRDGLLVRVHASRVGCGSGLETHGVNASVAVAEKNEGRAFALSEIAGDALSVVGVAMVRE